MILRGFDIVCVIIVFKLEVCLSIGLCFSILIIFLFIKYVFDFIGGKILFFFIIVLRDFKFILFFLRIFKIVFLCILNWFCIVLYFVIFLVGWFIVFIRICFFLLYIVIFVEVEFGFMVNIL